MTYKNPDKYIPADFDPGKCTLLIGTHPLGDKQTKRIEAYLQKNYPWKYKVVPSGNLTTVAGGYQDTKQYPFAVGWTMDEGPGSTTTAYSSSFSLNGYFVDRSTGKQYPQTQSHALGQVGFMPFLKMIIDKYKAK